jgi:lipopolysaccharide/colanic/teichoic acid biosynthesis glycosyltransferase
MKLVFKHLFIDKLLALIIIIFTLPFFVLIATAVFMDSGRPIIYRQKRVGKECKSFTMYKFRTMVEGKKTKVGRVLRKSSLDELPQLVNVVLGQMSLVGPRPPMTNEPFAWADLFYRYRMRPGMTGLWQVAGRANLSEEIRVELDMLYVAGWSLLIDLKILLRTIPAVFTGRGAN